MHRARTFACVIERVVSRGESRISTSARDARGTTPRRGNSPPTFARAYSRGAGCVARDDGVIIMVKTRLRVSGVSALRGDTRVSLLRPTSPPGDLISEIVKTDISVASAIINTPFRLYTNGRSSNECNYITRSIYVSAFVRVNLVGGV